MTDLNISYERIKSFAALQRLPVLNVEGVIGMQIDFGNSENFSLYQVQASDGTRSVQHHHYSRI